MRAHELVGAGAALEADSEERSSKEVTKHTMRLLVISYHFPPDSAVGALRWGGITKYLARAGWNIHILTSGETTHTERVGGMQVHSIRRARVLNDLYRELVAYGSGPRRDEPFEEEREPGLVSPLTRPWRTVRHTLAVSLSYPDYSRGWVLKASRVAQRVIRRERIGLVVSSGPPHAAHLVAMLATARTDVRWFMDMRDPWYVVNLPSTPPIFRWSTRQLERMAFARARGVICNTRQYAERLRERGVDIPVHWIPNAIDLEDLPDPVQARAGSLTLAYVGSLYFNRDLGPVIRAMEAFLTARSPAERDGIRLRFAGNADPEHAARLQQQLQASRLSKEQVEMLGFVSRSQAWEVLQEAHLSLVLAQQQPMQVPAKLYESMALGVQTLVLAEPGSAAVSEAERIGALWRDPSDIAGIEDVLERLRMGRLSTKAQPTAPFDYEATASDVARLLTPSLP